MMLKFINKIEYMLVCIGYELNLFFTYRTRIGDLEDENNNLEHQKMDCFNEAKSLKSIVLFLLLRNAELEKTKGRK